MVRIIKKYTRKLFHYIANISGVSVTMIMATLAICDYMYCGLHLYGTRIHNHDVAVNRVEMSNAIAEGRVIRPKVPKQVKHNFASRLAQLDNTLPSQDRITPSLVIAQAALESDWGTSQLCREANNLFGVKGSYNGNYMTYYTNEFEQGKNTSELSDFKQYPNLESAVKDHNILLKQKFLQGSSANDYVGEAEALQRNHYATDPNYAQKLMQTVERNDLTRYD